jgi:putative salt-induced outer membrane protein
MLKSVLYILFFAISCVILPVYAQDAEEEENESSIAVGYVGTTGNSEITTFEVQYLLTYHTEKWTHNFDFETLTVTEDGEGKAERYFIGDKSDYHLLVRDRYLYVQGSYTDDRFSGFNYQAIISGGLGQYFIDNDAHNLEGFVGLGFRQNDSDLDGAEGEAVLTLGEDYEWQITESSDFTQDLTFEIGDQRTVTTFNIGLESEIMDRLSTRIAFRYRNNSNVPFGKKQTDTLTVVSLVYTF